MDPKILQQLMAQGGQQAPQGQPQQPQGQPGGQSDFNPDQNPFEGILAGLQQNGPQQAAQQSQQPQGPQPIMTSGGPQMPQNQLEPGKNPSGSRPLGQAIGALQNYIAQSTDRDSIMIARNIVKLLTKLMGDEEEAQISNLQQGF